MLLPKQIAVLLTGYTLVSLSVASAAEVSPKKSAPATKVAPPDVKFLEYLGTLEADDENWTQVDLHLIAAATLPAQEGKTNAKAEAAAKPAAERK